MTDSTTVVNEPSLSLVPDAPIRWWPKGCSQDYFRRVVAAAETAYIANGRDRLPDVRQVITYMGGNPEKSKVAKIINSKEFKSSLLKRGIDWSGKALGITPEQSYALHIVADPSLSRIAFNTRLKRAGITYQRWQNWMHQPLFAKAFTDLTENNLSQSVGIAHTALIGKAAEGDMRAIEFLYQITGRFDPAREANMNMNAILLSILEVLTTRITDGALLAQIGEDLEKIISTQNTFDSRPALGNTIDAEVIDATDIPIPATSESYFSQG